MALIRNRLLALPAIVLTWCWLMLVPGPAAAFDIERAFENFDSVSSGEIGIGDLTEEERAEVMVIQNTFDQLERNQGDALDWVDCHSAETMTRQQAAQLGAMGSRLAACAQRNDLSSLLTAANSLATCARSGGGLDHCNSKVRRIEQLRDSAKPCLAELRAAVREQRHLATFRLREAEMCPAKPIL